LQSGTVRTGLVVLVRGPRDGVCVVFDWVLSACALRRVYIPLHHSNADVYNDINQNVALIKAICRPGIFRD